MKNLARNKLSQAIAVVGAKGSESRSPVEAPNTLKSVALARIVDLVSEGPIFGLTNGLKSVYLDETPVENADGSRNFTNFQVDYRLGTPDQDYMKGFSAVENEIAVGVELKQEAPFIRSFTNTNIDALRIRLSVPALSRTNRENGDINGHIIYYAIAISTDGGPYVTVENNAFNGKTMSKYERDSRIDLPKAQNGWNLRITRLTANANSAEYNDLTQIESITEIVDAKLRYPNSAIVGVTLEATQFQNIPGRAYDLKGRIIRVPTNYDPESRIYNGIWDGTFKLAWTDNPAWIYYDLATHPRYGLGHLITDQQVNKWMLYSIAQYCDQLVPDGKGGQEPRFTCNLYLQKQAEAYRVLQDLATVFRGIAYWGNGEIRAIQDRPEDPVYTYSPANVIEGQFNYEGSGRKTRFNVALVSWNDMTNMGRAAVEYVDDPESIMRLGIQQTDATGIGCTSQGQAQRIGRYLLATSRLETQTVTFKVGLDGTLVAPGKIVLINDPLHANVRLGGRLTASSRDYVTVDGDPGLVEIGDTIRIALEDGTLEAHVVQSIIGNEIKLATPLTKDAVEGAMWSVERENLQAQRYRIISVAEEENKTFNVVAVKHVEGKFNNADFGTKIDLPQESTQTPSVQAPVTDLTLSHYEAAAYVTTSLVLVASWKAAANAIWYEVDYKRDGGEWVRLPRTQGTTIDIRDCWEGTYLVRVKAINSAGIMSLARVSQPYVLAELKTPPKFVGTIVDEVIAGLDGLPNFVSREEMLEAQQHMLTLGTIAYEEAGIAASAKYDVGRFKLQLDDIDARIARSEVTVADNQQAMVELTLQIGARFLESEAHLAEERTVRATQDEALAQSIDALQVQIGEDIQAQIVEERTARVTQDEALANSISQLNVDYGNLTARVHTEEQARADADEAMGKTISLIGVESPDGASFIIDINKAKISAGESLGQRLNTINTNIGANTSLINQEATTRATADNALTSLIALIGAKNAAGTAFIMDLNKTYVSSTESWAVRLANITSSIGQNAADIVAEASARSSADGAIASSVNTLSTTVNGHTSSISQNTNSINGIQAKYSVKVDNNGYVSGFGLVSEPNNGSIVATFSILADRFRIVSPWGGQRTEYSDGNWRMYDGNGTLRVRIGIW